MRVELVEFGLSWSRHGYLVRHWTEQNLPPLINQATYDDIANGVNVGGGDPELGVWVQRADVVSYELVFRYGGIYANTDIECLRSLDPIVEGVTAFAGIEQDDKLCNALMGCTAGHPFFKTVVEQLPAHRLARRNGTMNEQTGPHLLTDIASGRDDLTVFPQETFYPYNYMEMDREWDDHPRSYTSHHWGHTRGRWSVPR